MLGLISIHVKKGLLETFLKGKLMYVLSQLWTFMLINGTVSGSCQFSVSSWMKAISVEVARLVEPNNGSSVTTCLPANAFRDYNEAQVSNYYNAIIGIKTEWRIWYLYPNLDYSWCHQWSIKCPTLFRSNTSHRQTVWSLWPHHILDYSKLNLHSGPTFLYVNLRWCASDALW